MLWIWRHCLSLEHYLLLSTQTEKELNEWKEALFDAHSTLQVARYKIAVTGADGDYKVLQDINKALEMCRKVIQEMLRILNPAKKEYKTWYEPQERLNFLEEIGLYDKLMSRIQAQDIRRQQADNDKRERNEQRMQMFNPYCV